MSKFQLCRYNSRKISISFKCRSTISVALTKWLGSRVKQNVSPYWTDIFEWKQAFMRSDNVYHRGGHGRPSTSEGTNEAIMQLF